MFSSARPFGPRGLGNSPLRRIWKAKMIHEKRITSTLFQLLKYYPWVVPAAVVLGIASSIAEGLGISLFIPFLHTFEQASSQPLSGNPMVKLLNEIFTSVPPERRLLIIPLLIFVSIFLKNLLFYSNMTLFSWVNSGISHWLRSGTFNRLLRMSGSFFETKGSGELLNTLASETWRTSEALEALIRLIVSVCTIIVFGVLLMLISWKLTLLICGAMLLISVIIRFVTRQVKSLGQQALESNARLSKLMVEGLAGIRVIWAFNRETYEQERFDRASKQVRRIFLKLGMLSGAVNPLYEVVSSFLILGILEIALLHDKTNLPILLTSLIMLFRLQPQLQQLDQSRIGLLAKASSVREVMSFLDDSKESYVHSGHIPFQGLRSGIRLDAVSFRYGRREEWALHDVSITIPRGKTTALVGRSGSGKSTLVNLLCRFYDATEGDIYCDRRRIGEYDLVSWRNRLAIVSHDSHVFSDTVRENIAYGKMGATETEVIKAAKLAHAHEFISQLPGGYDTQVGERGMSLSGGQRQRIALARAIIRDPEILILDEATNALDTISEYLIQDAMNAVGKERTVILVAHRLSTIERADLVFVLDDGRIVEQGSLPQLLQLDGLFASLYQRYQHSSEELKSL